jgi:hypothetical protein
MTPDFYATSMSRILMSYPAKNSTISRSASCLISMTGSKGWINGSANRQLLRARLEDFAKQRPKK